MRGIVAASIDHPTDLVQVVPTARNASYVPPRNGQPGYLLWMREQTLLAQPFDAGKLKRAGDPAPVAENVSAPPADIYARFWTSDAGILAYRTSAGAGGSSLTWLGPDGNVLSTIGKAELYGELALSPDGSQIAAFRRDNVGEDLWLVDVARSSSVRLTTDPANESFPVWSPDGKQVAFSHFLTRANAGHALYRKPAGVAGAEELLLQRRRR